MRTKRWLGIGALVVAFCAGAVTAPLLVGTASAARHRTYTYYCGRNGATDAGLDVYNTSATKTGTVKVNSNGTDETPLTVMPHQHQFFGVDHSNNFGGVVTFVSNVKLFVYGEQNLSNDTTSDWLVTCKP